MDWFLFAPFASLYFVPTFVAMRRGHRNAVTIGAVNLVLGWTLLGWALALAWALTHNTRKEHALLMYDLSRPGGLAVLERNRHGLR